MVCRRNTRIGRMIYLGLGSNVGDRLLHLRRALTFLSQAEVQLIRTSRLYQSPPWGELSQDPYWNAAVEIDTRMSPIALLHTVKQVEQRVGRTPTYTWGPREIDLDILEYHAWQIKLDELSIPHPYITQRGFVLQPMLDLVPDYVPVGQSFSAHHWLDKLPNSSLMIMADTDWYDGGQ